MKALLNALKAGAARMQTPMGQKRLLVRARQQLPTAGINTGLTLLTTGNPLQALTTGGLDAAAAMGTGALARRYAVPLAGRFAPSLVSTPKRAAITKAGSQIGLDLAGSFAAGALVDNVFSPKPQGQVTQRELLEQQRGPLDDTTASVMMPGVHAATLATLLASRQIPRAANPLAQMGLGIPTSNAASNAFMAGTFS